MQYFSAHQLPVWLSSQNPNIEDVNFFVSLRYLYFGVLPHLRGKNSVPTQFWSLQVPGSHIWRDCPQF